MAAMNGVAHPKQGLLSQYGFESKVDPNYKIAGLNPEERLQVRSAEHVAPAETVRQYAAQMSEGAVFLPGIITKDRVMVDGNTRLAAQLANGVSNAAMLVVDIDFRNATEEEKRKLHLFAAQCNQENGLRLTDKEARRAAKFGLRQNWTAAHCAKVLGVASRVVTSARQEVHAEDALDGHGFDIDKVKRDNVFRVFGKKVTTDLYPDLYKSLWQLKLDANLNAEEVTDLAKQCSGAQNEKAAKAILTKARVDFDERIKNHATTGNGQPAPSRELRRALGIIAKYEGNEAVLVETNAASIPAHVTALSKSITVLQTVFALQQAKTV